MTSKFDKKTIMAHIKDLTPDSMTVFITEPFTWESRTKNLPYTAGDIDRFTFDGVELTARGYGRAKEALGYMTNVALFYVAHKDDLRRFYEEYDAEYVTLSQALNAIKEQQSAAAFRSGLIAFIRRKGEIEDEMRLLFNKMYRSRFGMEPPIIYQELFKDLERFSRSVFD